MKCPRDYTWPIAGSIARICKKLVMPLPIIGQQQRINHCSFGIYKITKIERALSLGREACLHESM